MDIISFYRALLKDVSVVDPNEDGFLVALYKGEEIPVSVEGKRLVLPTKDILKGGNWESRIAFHPISEKINRGESPVLKALKDYIYLRVNATAWSLVQQLLKAGANPEQRKKPDPKVADYLRAVGEVDDTVVSHLKSIIGATSKDPERRLISIYLKHGSTGKEGFARQAIVSFPIMDEFDLDEPTIFGVKMSKKAKNSYRKVFEYIFGDEETRKQYSFGSNNLEAPYFHALTSAFYKLAVRMNHLIDLHAKILEEPEEMKFDLSWAAFIDQLALFRGVIPAQPGNDGDLISDGKDGKCDKQAAEIFDRKPTAREVNAPWPEEERRTGPDDRRGGAEDRRMEHTRPGSIGMDEFRAQFRKNEPERRGGFFRDERRSGFSGQVDRDYYRNGRDEPRSGGWRDDYRRDSRGTRRGGYL